jgi:histone deacetylase complex regulatory component SIN3
LLVPPRPSKTSPSNSSPSNASNLSINTSNSVEPYGDWICAVPQGYCNAVKDRFRSRNHIYQQFLSILQDHKNYKCVLLIIIDFHFLAISFAFPVSSLNFD